jgi:hypothetical protein
MSIHEHVLKFVCIELQCQKLPPANIHKNKMTKIDWVKMLCDWVSILSKLRKHTPLTYMYSTPNRLRVALMRRPQQCMGMS